MTTTGYVGTAAAVQQELGRPSGLAASSKSPLATAVGTEVLDLLSGAIDLARVPFGEHGSRLLVVQEAGREGIAVRIAER